MKKELPILFSTPMVKAILEGRKTMTRRIIKPQPRKLEPGMVPAPVAIHPDDFEWPNKRSWRCTTISCKKNGPTGWVEENSKWKVGDILWVRETLYQEGELGLYYVAGNEQIDEELIPENYTPYRNYACCKVPNIHMQKSVARIWLEITDVRVERLKMIDTSQALMEGFVAGERESPTDAFHNLWDKINPENNWEANPWVWVVSFKILSTTGKPILEEAEHREACETQ